MGSLPRVFSGIQPSGNLHLGNYLGAIHTWVQEQNQYDNFFCIVDLHAITVPQDPAELRKNVRDLAALYLAAGISLEHATIFVQSHVPAHVELGWILNCQTPLGWLNRMTQFKDKSQKQETVAAGLMNYPTLMAADILLYDTQVVPVGDDQRQHIELTRDIAERFNHLYGETFVIPEALIRPVAARVMGLDDPTQKMSKSNKAANHSIPLLSDLKATRKAIMRAVTDSGSEIKFDETRPGVNNLLGIYQALTGRDKATIEAEFEGQGYGKLKGAVADVVIATLEPLQQRYNQLTADPAELDGILKRGAERAAEVANATLLRAYQQLGLR